MATWQAGDGAGGSDLSGTPSSHSPPVSRLHAHSQLCRRKSRRTEASEGEGGSISDSLNLHMTQEAFKTFKKITLLLPKWHNFMQLLRVYIYIYMYEGVPFGE